MLVHEFERPIESHNQTKVPRRSAASVRQNVVDAKIYGKATGITSAVVAMTRDVRRCSPRLAYHGSVIDRWVARCENPVMFRPEAT